VTPAPEAWIVFDLGFGDAGKGTITDFLVRSRGARCVVRWNGGAQAGHNVVMPEGTHHTFSQFGAGTLVDGVRTHLGPGFVLHPLALLVEAQRLSEAGVADALDRLSVDARCLLVSPFQQAAGRLRELRRGAVAHGTCGVGVGEAVGDTVAGHDDALRARDLSDASLLRVALARQQERKRAEMADADLDDPRAGPERELLEDTTAVARVGEAWRSLAGSLRLLDPESAAGMLRDAGPLVFEGAQGVLLDEAWGFHPHTTWSDCTPRGALALLGGLGRRVVRLGVVRSYATRHGIGPFPTHDPAFDEAFPEPHNERDGWQGPFRRGPLDLVLLRYALEVCGGVDGVAITCLDRVAGRSSLPLCVDYGADPSPGLLERDSEGSARLVPGEASDQGHRQRLGELLSQAKPRLLRVPPRALAEAVEQRLGATVWLESAGPTAMAKRWRRPPDGARAEGGSAPKGRARPRARTLRRGMCS
jgi:adenylosuccinate synthase